MPVVTLDLTRLGNILRTPVQTIVDTLPYLGLDIEGTEGNTIRVEYSPNRPDYGSEAGILRGLKGLLGIETGTLKYSAIEGITNIEVEDGVTKIRPYIVGLVARNIKLDDESIRQIISLQEDLHNGVGRRRRLASIGVHDFSPLRPPIRYTVVDPSFQFIPLGAAQPMTIERILMQTEQGRKYGSIVSGFGKFPMLVDSVGNVLSMPPVINGVFTAVTDRTDTLFIDITATSQKAANTCLNVLACQLADMGAKVESVKIVNNLTSIKTPMLDVTQTSAEIKYIQGLLGLKLTSEEIVTCLARSRLTSTVQDGKVTIEVPSYRSDIIHPADITEEVALGYHIARFKPTLPRFKGAGRRNPRSKFQNSVRTTMIGLGYTEVITPTLVDSSMVSKSALSVEEPKSSDYEYLRDRLIPSVLRVLSRNKHESYPQRIFEIGHIFGNDERKDLRVREGVHVAAASAHADANFTEIRSSIDALLQTHLRIELKLKPTKQHPLAKGRCASIIYGGQIGCVGEVAPDVLSELGLEVPVGTFEIDLEPLMSRPTF